MSRKNLVGLSVQVMNDNDVLVPGTITSTVTKFGRFDGVMVRTDDGDDIHIETDFMEPPYLVGLPEPKAGRPAINGERMEYHTIATTAEQWEHVQANGGAEYVRRLIDQARGAA